MINEDYCSYEVAKLLKEKGFDGECRTVYKSNGCIHDNVRYEGKWLINSLLFSSEYSAPTLQMAMKWLREVHNIFIDIYLPSHSEHEDTIYHGTYSFDIFNLNTKVYVYCTWNEKEFNSYEEAVEAALKYVLENLI